MFVGISANGGLSLPPTGASVGWFWAGAVRRSPPKSRRQTNGNRDFLRLHFLSDPFLLLFLFYLFYSCCYILITKWSSSLFYSYYYYVVLYSYYYCQFLSLPFVLLLLCIKKYKYDQLYTYNIPPRFYFTVPLRYLILFHCCQHTIIIVKNLLCPRL